MLEKQAWPRLTKSETHVLVCNQIDNNLQVIVMYTHDETSAVWRHSTASLHILPLLKKPGRTHINLLVYSPDSPELVSCRLKQLYPAHPSEY